MTVPPAGDAGDRAQVRTVAFVDLCSYTRMTGVHGDERAAEQLSNFRQRVRAAVGDGGVQIVRWLGDGVLLASSDPRAMLDTLASIDDEKEGDGWLAVRAGVATGAVVAFDGDDIAGATVNLAARLCEVAAPHQILAEERTAAAVVRELVEPQQLHLKGFPVSVLVGDLARCAHGHRRIDPLCGMELEPGRTVVTSESAPGHWFCSQHCVDQWTNGPASLREGALSR